MNLRQLEIFRAIMQCRTITDAARMLMVSQPSLSKTLRYTEDRLGMKLFRREKGRLYPTVEAERLYPEADRLFRHLRSIQRLAGDLRDGHSGLLRLGASSSLGLSVLPEAACAYLKDNPGVKVVMHNLPAAELTELANTHQIDLGITLSPINAPTSRVEVVGQVELVCILPPKHPLAKQSHIEAADINRNTLITYSRDTHFGQLIAEFLEDTGMVQGARIEVGSTIAACPMVERGAGIALVDKLTADLSVAPLEARPLRPRQMLQVNMVSRSASPMSHYAADFIPYLTEALAKYTAPQKGRAVAS